MAKVTIIEGFHRFMPNPASTKEKPLRELREDFPKGKTVDVSDDDAESWIEKGLAERAKPVAVDEPARLDTAVEQTAQ